MAKELNDNYITIFHHIGRGGVWVIVLFLGIVFGITWPLWLALALALYNRFIVGL